MEADQLRREIEHTQRGLSADVNALTEKVTPSRIVHRRMGRARRAMTNAKDKIMGTTSTRTTEVGDRMSTAASSAAETVAEAPRAIRQGTEGNPLAAGLIAFGAGWLAASLLPPTEREQQLADQAVDVAREYGQPVADQAGEMARQFKEDMREPAQQAVESVKSTAEDAGSTVASETRSAAQDVSGQTRQGTENVKAQTQQPRVR
jgi:hypothetical protein